MRSNAPEHEHPSDFLCHWDNPAPVWATALAKANETHESHRLRTKERNRSPVQPLRDNCEEDQTHEPLQDKKLQKKHHMQAKTKTTKRTRTGMVEMVRVIVTRVRTLELVGFVC